jgi:hypothetical protein
MFEKLINLLTHYLNLDFQFAPVVTFHNRYGLSLTPMVTLQKADQFSQLTPGVHYQKSG